MWNSKKTNDKKNKNKRLTIVYGLTNEYLIQNIKIFKDV